MDNYRCTDGLSCGIPIMVVAMGSCIKFEEVGAASRVMIMSESRAVSSGLKAVPSFSVVKRSVIRI